MSTASISQDHWLELISQCRSSGLTDRQWCIQNGIPTSTFYYHVKALRKKACEIPETSVAATQKQEVGPDPALGNRITSGYRSGFFTIGLPRNCRGSVSKSMNRPGQM